MKGKEELSFVWLLLEWVFVVVVVVTTFSIGVSIKKTNLLHCWLTSFSFPKYFPDPEKQRLSESSKKVLTMQLFQAVSSAEDTNKLWCTKSQGSQWNFWELDALKEQLSLGCGRRPWASFCSVLSNVSTASVASLELPRPSRLCVFMPLCPSSCSGVWNFTRLSLLGQTEATIKSIKIWITSNRPVTNVVKKCYLLASVHSQSYEWHKGLMGLRNKIKKKNPITPHLSVLGIAVHGCMR